MSEARYAYRLRQGPKTIARASLNDLPFVRDPSAAFRDTVRPCDHLLVPGENVLLLEVWDGPPSVDSPLLRGPVDLTIHEVETEKTLTRIAWPALAFAAGQTDATLVMPFVFAAKFAIPEEHPKPIYESNPSERIPEEGTPDLHAAVERLHDALAGRNASAFVGEFSLKLSEQRRFHGDSPELDEKNLIAAYERRFADPLDVRAIDPRDLRFEPRSNGRVAYVTRRDGTPVYSARGVADPGQSFELDPLFVRHDQRWTLLG
jgi:hypothetical protein